MIIDVTYCTDTDVGSFYSSAKLNANNGEIFQIQSVEDPMQENIEKVFKESIEFEFENQRYELEVKFDDSSYKVIDYEDTMFYKFVQTLQMKNKLDEQLNNDKTIKKQYKL